MNAPPLRDMKESSMTEAERLATDLDRCAEIDFDGYFSKAAAELRRLSAELEALKKAISEAEPVAHIRKNGFRFLGEIEPQDDSETPLYTLKGIK